MNPTSPRPDRRRTPRGRPSLAALAALGGLAVALAGCGGSSHASGTTTTPPASATSGATSRPAAYARCMRAHGVPNFPNPVDGHITLDPASGIDPTSPAFQAASRACAALGPSGPAPGTATGDGQPTTTTPDTSATASVTAATWRDFGRWLAARAAAGQFSGAALVAHGNRVLLDAGYGLADRATGIANAAQTRFCIASIGKLFTAIAIAQLVQDHKLPFGDAVGRYLTGFAPAVADHVTIAELLDMTAGLGDVALAGPHPPTTLAGQLKLIAKERPQAAPGVKFVYSNDDYIVLGAVIEHVTGQTYTSYVQAHVLDPAGMTHTDLTPYTPAQVPGMAHGYALTGTTGTTLKDISAQLQVANPSGGASSTTGDLLHFARALLDHTLLSPAMTAAVLTPRVDAPQPGGPPVNEYTYGFAYQAINGISFVGHNGGTPGYEGQLDIYPASGYVVAILTNQDQTLIPAIQRSESLLTGR